MTDFKDLDSWTDESFEDIVTRSMIALYETKLDKCCATTNRLARFTMDDMLRIRKHGIIIPAPDRLYLDEGDDSPIDGGIAELSLTGCFSFGEDTDPTNPDHMDTYCEIKYFRRVNKLPHKAASVVPGLHYEMIYVYPQHNSVLGTRSFVTVNPKTRKVTPCVELGSRPFAQMLQLHNRDPDILKMALGLKFGMQVVDDFRHQWRITAHADDTKVTVGAYAENVKSLLYARTLPMTPTGRKRPILHVVSAHRRRMKEGTEIDIDKFLRGTREIEMDGTLFKVDAPDRLIQEMLAAKAK